MGSLTRRQAAFVAAYVAFGDTTKAAEDAGYSRNGRSAEKEGRRLIQKPHVRAQIERELVEAFVEDGPVARATLLDVCRNGRSEQARVLAAGRILDRAVGPVEQVRRLVVHDQRSDDDLRAAIAARIAANPDLAALLAGAPMIDGKALPVLASGETASEAAGHADHNGDKSAATSNDDVPCQQSVNGCRPGRAP